MNKKELAIHEFRNGLNCAQAVLVAFSEELGFNRQLALGVTAGFGSGMGRLQLTCGAVTGSYMAIGIYNSRKYDSNADSKLKSAEMIRAFTSEFIKENKTICCRELLNCDLSTEEGQRFAKENNLFGTTCVKCIGNAIDILDHIKTL